MVLTLESLFHLLSPHDRRNSIGRQEIKQMEKKGAYVHDYAMEILNLGAHLSSTNYTFLNLQKYKKKSL